MNVTPGVIASPVESLLTDLLSTTQCARNLEHDTGDDYGFKTPLIMSMASLPPPPPSAMAHNDLSGVTMTFILAALLLSLLTIGQVVASHAYAYSSAPIEVQTFLEAANSSIAENESFDHDIMRLQASDRPRLIKLLGSIQKCGDDLLEDLNKLTVEGSDSKLKTHSMLLWKTHKERLEARLRRLDLLRMRFLILQMGLVAASLTASSHPVIHHGKAAERRAPTGQFARPVMPQHALTETIKKISEKKSDAEKKGEGLRTTPRRVMSAQTGHNNQQVERGPQFSMASVISELQSSPKLHMRRASIERRTSIPMSPTCPTSPTPRAPMSPMSPLGSGWRFEGQDT